MQAIRVVSRMLLPLIVASCVTSPDDIMAPPNDDEPDVVVDPKPDPDPGTTETPAEIAARLLDQWTRCMVIEDFHAADMARSWGQMTSTTNHQCQNCHSDGIGGFIATDFEARMFDELKTKQYNLLQYVTVDVTNPATASVVINRQSFRGVGRGEQPHAEHPRFDAENNAGMVALQKWHGLVQARVARECAPAPQ